MMKYLKKTMTPEDKHFFKNVLIFAGIFVVVFSFSIALLHLLGFVPQELENGARNDTFAAKINESAFGGVGLGVPRVVEQDASKSSKRAIKGELPNRIVAASIGLDTAVEHPASLDYSTLNNALMKGPVYYPGSGLSGAGNMFIFGHSTSFSIVNNKAYQVFNNIKNLKSGDEIRVYGETKVYVYKVRKVELVNAEEALVDLSGDKNMLTLSTCNSFGKKTDRYIAEADLVSTDPL